ncbi:class I SAM-dependent methyltransferase [Patescibacteria group bacterium]|nr:class I SAM-dependent methyltransferase [Patescibacteria group bacterium]MBU1705774.1 class I SAM-dependent methyltransferase [Patescibacteria group bacterium]
MENQALFEKYVEGRHWDNHPDKYAVRFAGFLKKFGLVGTVLDVGCGSGRDVAVFKKNGLRIVGLDNDLDEIALASLHNPDVTIRLMDAHELRFPSETVAAAYMVNVIHYLKAAVAIAEIFRVLKPGGHFLVHFNRRITDHAGQIDYELPEATIADWTRLFRVVQTDDFQRFDIEPLPHTHLIRELILMKP